jgi:hypothetical protein
LLNVLEETALRDSKELNEQLNHMMDKMIVRYTSLQNYQQIFDLSEKKHDKNVVEAEPWT